MAPQWLPCQVWIIGSALGLVSPVSIYCDWVRWKVWSATSVSVWQHIQLSVQICPWDTPTCCWDVEHPTNNVTKKQRTMSEFQFINSSLSVEAVHDLSYFPSVCVCFLLFIFLLVFFHWLRPSFCLHVSFYFSGLVGLVVRRPPREWKILGSNPACAGIFSGSSHTSDSKIGTPVATLPGAWRYRVSTATGRPCVSILWLGEVESLICNFYFSVAAREIVWADPSLRYTILLLRR